MRVARLPSRMDDPVAMVDEMRRMKDHAFRVDPGSPIPRGERASFAGLKYFPVDPAMRFVVPLVGAAERRAVSMQTSDGQARAFDVVGHFELPIAGRPVRLHAFNDGFGHGLFVPFRDATSGKETYGGGRYLEVEEVAPGTFVVDLNRAYNPFCAYNEAFSCPFPPFENWLQVPVRAGEKTYKE